YSSENASGAVMKGRVAAFLFVLEPSRVSKDASTRRHHRGRGRTAGRRRGSGFLANRRGNDECFPCGRQEPLWARFLGTVDCVLERLVIRGACLVVPRDRFGVLLGRFNDSALLRRTNLIPGLVVPSVERHDRRAEDRCDRE